MKNQSKKNKTINRVNQCKCGGHYIKQNKKRHFQTKKHEGYLLKQGKPRFFKYYWTGNRSGLNMCVQIN